MKTPIALNFINQFASGNQLAHQIQQSRNYNEESQYSKHPKINLNLII